MGFLLARFAGRVGLQAMQTVSGALGVAGGGEDRAVVCFKPSEKRASRDEGSVAGAGALRAVNDLELKFGTARPGRAQRAVTARRVARVCAAFEHDD